jgi:hypothetical protein
MKFLADGMLGKLTRWLRILGQDVKYCNTLNDEELMSLAEREDRALLTRDCDLFKRSITRGLSAFLIETIDHVEQLAQLSAYFSFSLDIDLKLSRCPRCGTRLLEAAKENLSTKVQKNTYDNYAEFWHCHACGQIYWQGAHWDRIQETLREAKEKLSSS